MTQPYAARTEVTPERSLAEIERILIRFGATKFATMRDTDVGRVSIAFNVGDQAHRMGFPIPRPIDFALTPTKQRRTPRAQEEMSTQEYRRRWRSLALYLKALLDARESGIIDIAEALMPYAVLPSGHTVAEFLGPQMTRALADGSMPSVTKALTGGNHQEARRDS